MIGPVSAEAHSPPPRAAGTAPAENAQSPRPSHRETPSEGEPQQVTPASTCFGVNRYESMCKTVSTHEHCSPSSELVVPV